MGNSATKVVHPYSRLTPRDGDNSQNSHFTTYGVMLLAPGRADCGIFHLVTRDLSVQITVGNITFLIKPRALLLFGLKGP